MCSSQFLIEILSAVTSRRVNVENEKVYGQQKI